MTEGLVPGGERAIRVGPAIAAWRAGASDPVELLARCLEAIEAWEPSLQAWVTLDVEGARRQAERCWLERRRGDARGWLHGLPVGVKDIVDVRGFPTRAGSQLTSPLPVGRDAELVRRLRDQGAVILGKTVTTEFACFDPPPTRNPWNASRTPGGSSSGSAVAVAAGMCGLAIGSQTGGSILRPATYCGVAGLKPAYGEVEMSGVVPVARSLDHVGPMAADVEGLIRGWRALAGVPCPVVDVPAVEGELADLPLKLGRPLSGFWERAEPGCREVAEEAVERLARGGWEVTDVPLPSVWDQVHSMHRRVMAAECAAVHRAQFLASPDRYGPCIGSLIEEGLAMSAVDYLEARQLQRLARQLVRGLLEDGTLLVTPATPAAAPDAATTGDPQFQSPWSFTGWPTVCLPCGCDVEGMPVGIQLIGEATGPLLAAAQAAEETLLG